MDGQSDISLTRQQAGLLMALYVRSYPELSCEQQRAFEDRRAACPSCAEEYEQERRLVALLRRHWQVGEGDCGASQKTPYRPMTGQERWEDLTAAALPADAPHRGCGMPSDGNRDRLDCAR